MCNALELRYTLIANRTLVEEEPYDAGHYKDKIASDGAVWCGEPSYCS